jgi:hypothetical protein
MFSTHFTFQYTFSALLMVMSDNARLVSFYPSIIFRSALFLSAAMIKF